MIKQTALSYIWLISLFSDVFYFGLLFSKAFFPYFLYLFFQKILFFKFFRDGVFRDSLLFRKFLIFVFSTVSLLELLGIVFWRKETIFLSFRTLVWTFYLYKILLLFEWVKIFLNKYVGDD